MASWTLWQPLVPRYQLTTKEITIDDVNTRPKSSPASPRPRETGTTYAESQNPRAKSSKSRRRTNTDYQDRNEAARQSTDIKNERDTARAQRGRATMYFTMASPVGSRLSDSKAVVNKPSFPVRRSPYIDTLKQQQRINSARQSTEDPSTASPRHKPSASPRHRKQQTFSQFPVTQIDLRDASNNYFSNSYQDTPRPKTAASRITLTHPTSDNHTASNLPKRMICKSAGASRDAKSIYVNTVDVSESTSRPFLKNPLYKDQTSPRRYAVRKLDDATMFIDDDKIIFIKKKTTKNDVLLSQNCTEEVNYIKHLRRLYLREPKDIGKLIKDPVGKKANVIRERLEYELKTDHILNYYSRVDDKQDASLWSMAIEESRKAYQTPQTTPRSSSGFKRAESARSNRTNHPSRNSSPPRSARSIDRDKERPVSARSIPYSNISSENVHINHDSLSDWNVFMKFNSRSILHERQFYLQTPATGFNNANDQNPNTPRDPNSTDEAACDTHECRLCRLEKEMGGRREIEAIKEENQNNTDVNFKVNINKESVKPQQEQNGEVKGYSNGTIRHCDGLETRNNDESKDTLKDKKPEVRTVATSTADDACVEKENETVAAEENNNTEHAKSIPYGLNSLDVKLPNANSTEDSETVNIDFPTRDNESSRLSHDALKTPISLPVTGYTIIENNENERGS